MDDYNRQHVEWYLTKIYNLFQEHRVINSLGCEVTCDWDIGNADVDRSIEEFDAFTFWVDGGEDYVDDEFNIILTRDRVYNGSMQEITFQDIKDYISDFEVVETKPITNYFKEQV